MLAIYSSDRDLILLLEWYPLDST